MNPLRKLGTLVMKTLGPAEVGHDPSKIPDAQATPSATRPVGDRDGDPPAT